MTEKRQRDEPGAMTAPRRVLILAPHPDDEIVACGLSAWRAGQEGARVFVLYLTTGVPPCETLWRWRRAGYAARTARRREEAEAAAALLRLEPAGFLDIPARRLRFHLDEAAGAIDRALASTRASELWVTAFEGAHQDHDAANALAARVRERLPVWEFAAYNYAGGRVRANRFADARGGVIELHLGSGRGSAKAAGPENLCLGARQSPPCPGRAGGVPPAAAPRLRRAAACRHPVP